MYGSERWLGVMRSFTGRQMDAIMPRRSVACHLIGQPTLQPIRCRAARETSDENPMIGTLFRIENRYFQFIHKSLKISLIVQLYDRNKSCQKCCLTTLHRSHPRSRQNCPDSKNSKIWQIRHRYFKYDHSVLVEIRLVRNYILNNLYLHDKLPIVHCSPSAILWSWPN